VVRKKATAAPSLGPQVALVTVERFCDLTEPQCAALDQKLAVLADRHPERLRVVFRQLPLSYPGAEAIALAAAEAHAQGKYTAFRDVVYAAGPRERRDVMALGQRAGLEPRALEAALAGGRRAELDDDVAWAARFAVSAVPELVWNGVADPGGRLDLDGLEATYDRVRAEAEALVTQGVPKTRLYERLVQASVRQRAALLTRVPDAEQSGFAVPARSDRVAVREAGAPSRGDPTAPVTVVVFGDYQCAHSRRLAETLTGLGALYPDRLRVVWKHAPLPTHPDAWRAARAAACAHEQGAFWAFQERLFAQPFQLDDDTLVDHAARLGLDVAEFRAAAGPGGRCEARVRRDLAEAERLGLAGSTPVILLNGLVVVGSRPPKELRALIESELAPGRLGELSAAR
jgi:protein-disulfide isomerase